MVGLIEIDLWLGGGGLTYKIFALEDMAVLASPDLLPELEVAVLDQELLVGGQPIVFHLHFSLEPLFFCEMMIFLGCVDRVGRRPSKQSKRT